MEMLTKSFWDKNNIWSEVVADNMVVRGNALDVLRAIPDCVIDAVITSPPYYSLRDYGDDVVTKWDDGWVGALGLEESVSQYLVHILSIFREVKRVLKDTGSIFVNLGDSYEDKSLLCIPFRFAIAMVEDGFLLRNDIIWEKVNCLPQSAKDRFCNNFEHVFFFSKSRTYYFKQQFEPLSTGTRQRMQYDWTRKTTTEGRGTLEYGDSLSGELFNEAIEEMKLRGVRNRRSVWSIPTESNSLTHFAVYPERLCWICLDAGCPVDGVVLDPFAGAGTTGVVAIKQKKKSILIELHADYINIMVKRLKETQPVLFGER